MQHTVHFMFGQKNEKFLGQLYKYIHKYAEIEEQDFFQAVLCVANSDTWIISKAEMKAEDTSIFVAGIENNYKVEFQPYYKVLCDDKQSYLKNLLTTIFNNTVTIDNPGNDSLLLNLHLNAYDAETAIIIKEFIKAAQDTGKQIKVDCILYDAGTAHIWEDNVATKLEVYQQKEKQIINELIEYKQNYSLLSHIILIQNTNNNGLSLNLDKDMITRIVGEYSLAIIIHYNSLYHINLEGQDLPLCSIGVSILSLDRYYYVQHLLHKCYIYILERERINQKDVDINTVSNIAQAILKRNINVFSDIYDKEVKTRLDSGKTQNETIAEISLILDKRFCELADDFQSYIDRADLSLPEKKATMAMLLGEDDKLLSGYLFDKKALTISDCESETINLFIEANNALLQCGGNIAQYAVFGNKTINPIDKIKDLKVKILGSTNYIRQKSQELESINTNLQEKEDSKKRLTEDGFFVFDDNTKYRLLPEIPEKLLEETYCPKENTVKNIDLRSSFTSIKDQGQIGSCASFSLVSIYEQILKKNNQKDYDLSERFVYYNVRKNKNEINEDNGATFFDVIQTMGEDGVCTEELCRYEEEYTEAPSNEAYIDGKHRLVTKAVNVNRNIDDIKSALAEGYPVAISLKIYDSFGAEGGFKLYPSDTSQNAGNHAMVICGYSDDSKFFIVRNSWGTSFGDKGYCYIPYSYIGNPNLLNMACIITGISVQEIVVKGYAQDEDYVFSFDLTDLSIKEAIVKNLISEEKLYLSFLQEQYSKCRIEYEQIVQTLGNITNRNSISDGTTQRLILERQNKQKKLRELEANRTSLLEKMRKALKINIVKAGIGLFALLVTFVIILSIANNPEAILTSGICKVLYILTGLVLVLCILMYPYYKTKIKEEDKKAMESIKDLSVEIANYDKVIKTNNFQLHFAGMVIDKQNKIQTNLKSKYYSMNSYIGNLSTWYEEEKDHIADDYVDVKTPFISILSNEQLDGYFETQKDNLTKGIILSELFKTKYKSGEKDIIAFKRTFKDKLIETLQSSLNDFSIINYLIGAQSYPYLYRNNQDISVFLQKMDKNSTPFICTQGLPQMSSESEFLFVETGNNSIDNWKDECEKDFNVPPQIIDTDFRFKLLICKIFRTTIDNIHSLRQ